MKKSIVTIVAFMLLALAGFAQDGDFVVVRIEYTAKGVNFYSYQNESVNKEGPIQYKTEEETLKGVGNFLKTYYSKGYKVVSTLTRGFYDEYILQKD